MYNRLCLAATLLFAATLTARISGTIPSAPSTHSPPAYTESSQAPPQTGYVGSDTCMACHSEGDTLKGTPHGQTQNPRSPSAPGARGCESCHGPGQAHVNDDEKRYIRNFDDTPATESAEACLTCHNRGDHAAWEGSAHERRNLSCSTCHSVHTPVSFEKQLAKASQTELCGSCHRVQVAKTERAVAHMPVREGKMACTSCHNPHGSISNVKALRVGSSIG